MADQKNYDVLIVGAGVAGAILAFKLAQANKSVLLIDGGPPIPNDRSPYMEQFYLNPIKVPESPYPVMPDNPSPDTLDIANWQKQGSGYLVQKGPLPFSSTYERVAGGTTWHWLGTSLRLVPGDFALYTNYLSKGNPPLGNKAMDWPITYNDLEPFYCAAEQEIGVAGDTANEDYLEITFGKDPQNPTQPYQYPMPQIPQSYGDQQIVGGIGQMTYDNQPVTVYPTPAGRNSVPYDERRVCAGNTNCIPICPIQAKYDATVHVAKAQNLGVDVWYQTIVTSVSVDNETGLVNGVNYLQYQDPGGPATSSGTATAKIYVLSAHAIETAKILLNSPWGNTGKTIANSSDQVGRNLMDHPIQLNYALAQNQLYPYRGPLATSGIESLRDGPFRVTRAAFRMEMGNEGWNWATGDPYTTVNALISPGARPISGPQHTVTGGQFGVALKKQVNAILTRQFRFGSLVEQMPQETNRVTLSTEFKDNLGIPRPQINYDLDDYTKAGYAAANEVAKQIFAKMGATEFTWFPPTSPSAFTYNGSQYLLQGAGHVMGTYRMGSDPNTSVVDGTSRSHDHQNLYLLGSGVFPSVGTANPTLTIAALALMTAQAIASLV
jgi:choline dehydrogenase-like flavoprotein